MFHAGVKGKLADKSMGISSNGRGLATIRRGLSRRCLWANYPNAHQRQKLEEQLALQFDPMAQRVGLLVIRS